MNIDLAALRMIEAEQGIPVKDMLNTIREAILRAYQKTYRTDDTMRSMRSRIRIDEKTGDVRVFVHEIDEEGNPLPEYDDTPDNFGRIAAATARQVIMSKLREAEEYRTYGNYQARKGEIIAGVVQRDVAANRRGMVVVKLGSEYDSQEGILSPSEQVPGESYEHGDRMKFYVVGVRRGDRTQILLSRTHPNLVRELFRLEVPEIDNKEVEIVEVAREGGHRSKIAVRSLVRGVNGKGSCIGPMGQRVRAVMSELNGEKIDIVNWDEDPARFVANALSPAKTVSVEIVSSEGKVARVIVPHYQLSLAIGREGQNARLAARLTGWRIDIRSDGLTTGPHVNEDKGKASE